MRKVLPIVACACLVFAADAAAQWSPFDGDVLVSVNGGVQTGGDSLTARATFPIYEELATVDASQEIDGGGLFDVGATVRLGELSGIGYGVGIAWSRLHSHSDDTVSGAIPHPVFFDRPRGYSATADDLDHTSRAIHFQAVWFVPPIQGVQIAVSAGPSFYTISQEFATGIDFSESADLTAVLINAVTVTKESESAVGFNIGADATYPITRGIGAGLMLRYTRGGADFDLGDAGSTNVKAGGFQVAAGLRLRL